MVEARAALQEAELNFEYATILAPVAGRVTRRTVEVGQVVQPGQPLLALVDAGHVWVIANYKETQLTHVRPASASRSRSTRTLVSCSREPWTRSRAGPAPDSPSFLPERFGQLREGRPAHPVKLVLEPGQNGHALLVPGMSVVPVIELR